ncbi:tRNA lysidine(34) synthetase TilS [Marinobacterium sp. AK62]|uniref:tRNA(Ile)-lysidine synthase n=1 Tax=Marinobacterium alkalitolerans TaxID=1542925 RepID=A0ABS3Z8U6_9GAMM|nr:tRNA lysidine(34) synthetase TilS [Marinobacterium alkalitolerans]MBP0048114.1 tRNA lysidine(34) synthetase TilS [Marinobacterium alkalitolerans]
MSSKTEDPVTALEAQLDKQLAEVPSEPRRWVIALSGGLDSSLLLELMARLKPSDQLAAIHVNHQLQTDADNWAERCRQHCERLGVSLSTVTVKPASATEADARRARYDAFEKKLKAGDCLLLAQHADDQAETLLLRLMRGAGVAGLTGMPMRRPLGKGYLLRPLLQAPRAMLEAASEQLGLEPIEDPSNAGDAYDRNWLRHHILPRLKQRWPQVLKRCQDTTVVMQDSRFLLEQRAQEDLDVIVSGVRQLDLQLLRRLDVARQRNVLHYWLARETGHRLDYRRVCQLQQWLTREAAQGQARLGQWQLRCYHERAWLLPLELPAPPGSQLIHAGETVELGPGLGQIRWRRAEQGVAPGTLLTLQCRQGGERLRPRGRGGSVSLKQLLQEAGIPPWLRPYQPLLLRGDEILAVPGVCLCEAADDAEGVVPEWHGFGLS